MVYELSLGFGVYARGAVGSLSVFCTLTCISRSKARILYKGRPPNLLVITTSYHNLHTRSSPFPERSSAPSATPYHA